MDESRQERLLFEDRLRALGGFIDRRGLNAISLVMEDDLVSLKARRSDTNEQVPEIRMNRDEMAALCREAHGRRGSGPSRPAGARPSRLSALRQGSNSRVPLSQWVDQTQLLSYQELLRAIGFDLDRWNVQSFRLDEFESGLILRVRKEGESPDVQQVHPLSKEELRTRIAQSLRRRGHQRPSILSQNSAAS